MLPILARLKTWWTAADRTQRVATVGGTAALLLLLAVTASFATRTRYETLMTGVQPLERGGMVEALTTAGIQAQADETGLVQVPAGRKDEALVVLQKANKLPKSGVLDLDALKGINMGTSQGVENETIRAVLEGRIASMLGKIEGVESATVLLTQPVQRLFADPDGQARPTASVTIAEGGAGGLGRKDGRTIAALVSKAVVGMTMADVVVTSTSGTVLWDGGGEAGGGGDTKVKLDDEASRLWEGKIQLALDGTFGPGNTRVLAQADLDMDRTVDDVHNVTPTDRPIQINNGTEKAAGRGAPGAGGNAGTTANTPGAPVTPPQNADRGTYENGVKSAIYEASRQDRHTEAAIGDLRGLALSVIVNSEKVTDPAAVQKIVYGLLGGRIKTDARNVALPNQAFTADVTSVKFDGTAAAKAKEKADADASAQRTQQILSLLPIGAILVVALLVAKQVGRISRAAMPAPADATDALEEGVRPEALPSGAEEGELSTVLASLEAGDEPTPEAETIKDRVNPPLESIKKMAADRPEMVATLIKSMMLGEKS